MKIYYPKLSTTDLGLFRIGGPGLANCMFLAAKAYVMATINNGKFVSPSWMKFSIGPLLRGERDKRVYSKIFKGKGIRGLSKIGLLLANKIFNVFAGSYGPYDLDDYFGFLNNHHLLVKDYFAQIERPEVIRGIEGVNFADCVAVHVRLGDYPTNFRVPMDWYVSIMKEILLINPDQCFLVFSDGSDEELKDLLDIRNVKRCFFGNAYADMKAISHCKLLLGSDSTFSAWGAFLGDVPILFAKRHFPAVYNGRIPELVVPNTADDAVIPFIKSVLVK